MHRAIRLPRPAAVELLASCLLVVLAGCSDPEPFGPDVPLPPGAVPVVPTLASASTNFWKTGAAMPTARSGLGAGVVNGVLYAVGGFGNNYLAINQAYTPGTNSWTTKAPLPQARDELNGTGVINGLLYVAGGVSGSDQKTNTLYAYNPSSNSWSTKAPMPVVGAAPSACRCAPLASGGRGRREALSGRRLQRTRQQRHSGRV
jgi:Kelch motif